MLSKISRAWRALAVSAGLLLAIPTLAMAHEHAGAPERIVDGTLEIVHIDQVDQSQSRFAYFLLTGEIDALGNSADALELRFERTPPASLKTGDRLNVRGRAVGRNLWVDDIAAANQDGSTATPQETVAESVTSVPRSTVTILVNITGTTTWTSSHIATAEGAMFYNSHSVDNLYAQASFNQTGFPDTAGTVVGPVTVSKFAGCPYNSYANAADQAATNAGVDVTQYQHRIYILPGGSVSDCNWLALGVVGSYGSNSTLRSWSTVIDSSALAHELGHNKGWHHAATDGNNNGFILAESTDDEYGDQSGTMGYCCTEKKFNAVHMDQIGWYDSQPAGTMLAVAGSGNYTLVPLGSDPLATPGHQILKVSKPDTGEVYYLSYRQPIGLDNFISASYTTGLNIHHASETGRYSYFIRALSDLQNFDDPANGLTIVQNWHDSSGVNVTISYDSCLPANPSVTMAPTTQMVDPNVAVSVDYSVTVSNNDSAGCDPSSFGLDSSLGTLANSTGLVSPGASSSPVVVSMNSSVLAGLFEGDNDFIVDADRGPNTGSGSGNLIADRMPPSAPGNPAAVQKKVKGQQRIEVTWGASSDDGSGVSEYRIFLGGNQIGTSNSLKFVDTSSPLSDPLEYSIMAVDGLNHVSAATLATFTPGSGGGSGGPGNSGGGKGKPKK